MYYLMSGLAGALIALTVAQNGGLAGRYGLYPSTAFVHLTGLPLIFAICLFRRDFSAKYQRLPLPYYLSGLISVITVVFNSMAFGTISVSAISALGLLGQCVTSMTIDHFGLLGIPRRRLDKRKFAGVGIVLVGIAVMLLFQEPTEATLGIGRIAFVSIISVVSGFTLVLSRTMNARVADKTSVYYSTFWNYLGGLVFSLLLMLLTKQWFTPAADVPVAFWMYLSGPASMIMVILCNIASNKISSFYVTLLVFVGQALAGVLLDTLLEGTFSPSLLTGGLLAALGLAAILWVDYKNQAAPAAEEGSEPL